MRCFVSGRGLQKNSFESSVFFFLLPEKFYKNIITVLLLTMTLAIIIAIMVIMTFNIKHNNIQVIMKLITIIKQ